METRRFLPRPQTATSAGPGRSAALPGFGRVRGRPGHPVKLVRPGLFSVLPGNGVRTPGRTTKHCQLTSLSLLTSTAESGAIARIESTEIRIVFRVQKPRRSPRANMRRTVSRETRRSSATSLVVRNCLSMSLPSLECSATKSGQLHCVHNTPTLEIS